MHFTRLFAISIAALAGCAQLDTSSTAQENHSWGGYHWARTSNPFTVRLGDNVSSVWEPILATTSKAWFRIGPFSLTVWKAPDHELPPGQPFFLTVQTVKHE